MKNKTLNDYQEGQLQILNHFEATITKWLDKERTTTCEELLKRYEQGSFDALRERYNVYHIILKQIDEIKEQLENE